MAEDEANDDWRRLKACPACDYSLETLPAEGVCPECGRQYDQRFIVLTGPGRGRWDGTVGGTWRGMAWQCVSLAVLLWLFSGGSLGMNSLQRVSLGVMVGGMLVVQMYGRLFSSREPGMQLWMSAEGVAQVASTPEARRAQWIALGMSLVFAPVFYAGLGLGKGRGPGSWWLALVFFAFMAAASLAEWRRRKKRAGRVEGGDFTPWLLPWGEVERVQVREQASGRARIRCMTKRRWGRIVVCNEWVIDIEIECPAKVAEALGRQMVEWCPKAGAAAV